MYYTQEGLPIPDVFETHALFAEQFEDFEDQLAPTSLGEELRASLSGLRSVIGFDLQMLTEEHADDMPAEHVAEMGYGLEHGYSIAVGGLTYINLLRSDSNNLQEFTEILPELLPPITDAEVTHIKRVRSGHLDLPADHPDIEHLIDSRDLAYHQTGQYFFEAPEMKQFLVKEIREYRKASRRHPNISAYCQGMRRGFEHAVGMYVECFQLRAPKN